MSMVLVSGLKESDLASEDNLRLLPLHPKELSDGEFSVYEAEFKKVLSDPLCRNIALSGPYGAGKSSVIEKVKRKQRECEKKWITISLATFGSAGDEVMRERGSVQNAVEAEILRQMVHKIGTSMAPKSRFRKLSDRKCFIDAIIAALVLAFVLLTAYLTSVSSALFSFQASYAEGFAFVIWLIIAGVGLYRLLRTNAISRMVGRIKIFEAELEITPSDSASPYERCVDEIVYLLNMSKVDAVVFEDLDRFDSVAIFERMRSLNALANDSRFCDAKRGEATPLRFFFLVRDGLFENPHDRTKFFDYVIPVIPYIDPNSALDVFRSALSGVGITVDEGFLYQLSSYIGDPRIVHDIADEAYHYRNALFKNRIFSNGDPERLLALLAYKALFPRDFESLQAGRGYLHEVLNGKQRLVAKLMGSDEAECRELQNELNDIMSRIKVSEDELICMFGAAEMGDIVSYLSGYNKVSDFDPRSVLDAVRQDTRASRQLESLMQQLEKNERYQARLLEVRGDANRKSEVVRTRLRELGTRSEVLRSMTIKQLVDELPDADALFNFGGGDIEREEDFKELSMNAVLASPFFPMLRFLVSSGYIDESYRRYISSFYSDTLCAEDDDFLSAIRQAKPIDLAYQPKSPGEIVRRMSPEMFSRTGNRDPWLVSALLDSEDERKIDAFMSSVKRAGGIRYLAEFIISKQFNSKIFTWMFSYFDNPIAELLSDEGVAVSDKRCCCKRCLVSEEGLRLIEKENGVFVKYIDSDSHFLEVDSRFDDAEIGERLGRVGYRAEAIDFSSASSDLLDFVYNNRLFMPAPSIVDGFLDLKFGVSGSMGFGTLITDALRLSDCPIEDVVSENMEYFVSGVVRESEVPLKDASEYIVFVLNDETIHTETAEKYIEALANVEVEDVAQVVSAEYRNILLAAQLVKCSADNVMSFYRWAENSISDDLAKLIEAKGAPIDLNSAKCEEAGVDGADIVGKIVECEMISVRSKKVVLAECGLRFSSFDIDGLDDGTVAAMIEAGAIEMNGGMLDKLRAYNSELNLSYVLSDLDTFLTLVGAGSSDEPERAIEENEVVGLLGSPVDISKKLAALSCFDGAIRLDKSYEVEVNSAIVAEHFDFNDTAELPSYYEEASGEYRDQIAKTFAQHDDAIIVEEVAFGWDLLCESLWHLRKDRGRFLRFLAWYLGKYGSKNDRDEVTRCFETAELEDYAKLMKGSVSMIPKSDIDDEMLSALAKLEMCGAVSADINAENLRRVYPKGHKRAK